jgi:hypothetical protein
VKGNDRERQRQAVEDRMIRRVDRNRQIRPSIGWPISIREFVRFRQPIVAHIMELMIEGK